MVMKLSSHHLLFDLGNELLLLLAGRATPAPMSLLASDLGLPGMRALRPVLGMVRQRGINIRMEQAGVDGYVASIMPPSVQKATDLAELYWRTVYAGEITIPEARIALRPAS